MKEKLRRAVFALASVVLVPAIGFAQQAAMVPPGKVLNYRTIDSDTGEQLQLVKVWQGAAEDGHPAIWSAATFPNGDQNLNECVQGNGPGRPATALRAVLLNSVGQVDGIDFETFDPAYSPFLHRPLPSQPLESASCFTASGLDKAALAHGEEASAYMWLNDAIYFRLIFTLVRKEAITVPAGKYETWRVHNRIDMTTLFPGLPKWAARLMGVFAPDINVWVTDSEPYTMIRFSGLQLGSHKHTTQELAGISDLPAAPPAGIDLLRKANQLPAEPKMTVDNSGIFEVADIRGSAILSSAKNGSTDLVSARLKFNDGLVVEARSVLDERSAPRTPYMEQRTYAPDGRLVQRKLLALRADSFPLAQDMQMPDDLYANSLTLGEVIPLVARDGEIRFHILGFDGQLNQLAMWGSGTGVRATGGGQEQALHMKLKPIINLPFYLKPLAYFLIPTFDLYLADQPSHRILEFSGPFGPPGSPSTHFVADGCRRCDRSRR